MDELLTEAIIDSASNAKTSSKIENGVPLLKTATSTIKAILSSALESRDTSSSALPSLVPPKIQVQLKPNIPESFYSLVWAMISKYVPYFIYHIATFIFIYSKQLLGIIFSYVQHGTIYTVTA